MKLIPHERANGLLRVVYKDGLDKAKTLLTEQASVGDKTARLLLNVLGNAQGKQAKSRSVVTERADVTPADLAGQVLSVLEARKEALLVQRLVQEMVHRNLPVQTALDTLKLGDTHAAD